MKRANEININSPEYWDEYNTTKKGYESNVRRSGLPRYLEVLKHVSKNSNILDLGSNFGDFLKYMLENKIEFKSYSGLDFSPAAIEKAKNLFPEYEWILADCQNLNLPNDKYDTIVAMQILEHLEKPALFVKKLYEMIKEDGQIIMTVPNDVKIQHRSHLWYFEKKDLEEMFYDSGFPFVESKTINDGNNILFLAKKKRRITVVTPVLCPSENVFNTIEKCFHSIRKAVDKVNAEWVIVDDNSLVGSKFFENIADVYLRNEKTFGVSYSLNRGMKNSKSEFLVKLDSDYLVPENLFEVLLNDWIDDLCFIVPSYTFGKPNDRNQYDVKQMPKTEGGFIDKPSGVCNFSRYTWGGGVMMFSAKVMKEVDYFDEEFGVGGGQDNDIIYRMLMKGYSWRWTNNVLCRHFASISSTDPNAPDSRGERRKIGREYFKKKHGFEPGGFISNVFEHFKYDKTHLS
ncbi:MAG: methyltransferase domain-containing protein [Methanogenium sp.]|jgi:2-polyprenyl-3-methyl-5-hydroxy-6-metoxy-1,4-benzoquinol methylase